MYVCNKCAALTIYYDLLVISIYHGELIKAVTDRMVKGR